MTLAEPLVDRIVRRWTWLDRVGDVLQAAVGGTYGALGRPGRSLKNLMHGTTLLGHPLHPAVTDVPIGAWMVGVVADFVAHYTNRLPTEAGDVALAVGLATALLAVLTGYTDYHSTVGHERRLGTVHGLTMSTVVTVDSVSMALRWWAAPSLHPLAVGLSTAGFVLVVLGGYLGGHLVFAMGTVVNHNAFAEGPAEYVAVASSTDFPEGEMRRVNAGGMPALAVRAQGRLYAVAATCSHAGGPLDEGTLEGTRVTCPWHGSVFCVTSGRVRGGPATFPLPSFSVRETDGQVELRLAIPRD
jgi:nitrite reductase/ring-hydroxylating ferredoxin subunit/uncharacterized membrane protein